ncbi:hypothetical protein EGM87_22855 [Sphingobium sp. RSMS]|uniref:hypothetical protein n=1 Tax=Sphingobium sp. RSMS TaxID=520734 RepID=UPI001C118BF0|nr:hypothetical protein [Sphingobium sp. RSMS]UXC93139.1 hypothetical protein EGM87_22855 [Sphingobium sp. RSMS]
MRREIFDAIKSARDGAPFTQAEVARVDGLLDSLGVPVDGAHKHKLTNPDAFFVAVRKVTGPLDQQQVDIINRLLAEAAHHPIAWLAYELATAWHESRLKPIEEWGKGKGREYGKVNSTGKAPYGRGLVQLTWHANYQRADDELGLKGTLIGNYDRALEPEIAVQIMVRGMEKGWFTGKSLGTYIGTGRGSLDDFTGARRIINGTDKADLIAGYAVKFQDALIAGGWA